MKHIKILQLILISVLLFLVGCSAVATGPVFTETKYYSSHVAPEDARIFIFRKSAGMNAAVRSTRVLLNGKSIGHCDIDGFVSFDVRQGEYIIAVDLPDTAGSCKIKVDAEAGEKYFFEVKPSDINVGAIVAGLFGGAAGAAAEDTITNSGLECGGAFSITPVENEYGERTILTLHLSD